MNEYIVTGTCNGRRAIVRIFAYDPAMAMRLARVDHGFTSTVHTKLA